MRPSLKISKSIRYLNNMYEFIKKPKTIMIIEEEDIRERERCRLLMELYKVYCAKETYISKCSQVKAAMLSSCDQYMNG